MISASLEAKSFKDFMKQLKQTTSNLAPAFRDFGEYLKKETDTQFKNEVDPSGKPWEPLKPATLARKKTTFKLRETLTMYNSIFYTADDKKFEFGIKDSKYQFHHTGTNKMAARVVIGITSARQKKANDFVIAQIRRVKGKRAQSRK